MLHHLTQVLFIITVLSLVMLFGSQLPQTDPFTLSRLVTIFAAYCLGREMGRISIWLWNKLNL